MPNYDGRETAKTLREQAARCRRLADEISDDEVQRRLLELAAEFDERAAAAEAREREHSEGGNDNPSKR